MPSKSWPATQCQDTEPVNVCYAEVIMKQSQKNLVSKIFSITAKAP